MIYHKGRRRVEEVKMRVCYFIDEYGRNSRFETSYTNTRLASLCRKEGKRHMFDSCPFIMKTSSCFCTSKAGCPIKEFEHECETVTAQDWKEFFTNKE